MRVDDLITAVRITGRLSDNDVDYTSARLRQELTDALHQVFGRDIIQSKSGAWLKDYEVTTTAGKTRYRIPYRACTGVGESVELDNSAIVNYRIVGDQVVFGSEPSSGSTLSFAYYLRPSLLVQEQSAGLVSSVTVATRQVVVNSLPTNRVTATPIASNDLLDIVHPNGWHELAIINASQTLSGTTITFASGTDMSDVEVGDYVRAADQTDWPCLPDDFHRVLADVTASRILRRRGYFQKADSVMAECETDLERFRDAVEPRLKAASQKVVPRYGILRGSFSRRWPEFPT